MDNKQAIRKLNFYLNGRNQQSLPCLVGPTGTSKTDILSEVAKDLNAELIYFDMSQQQKGDNAIPTLKNKTIAYTLNNKFQRIFDKPDKEYIIVCDEFNHAQKDVMLEWMKIITKHNVHGYELGTNVHFVATMNSSEDIDYVVNELDPAYSMNFNFIHLQPNTQKIAKD